MRNRYLWIALFLVAQCVLAYVAPAIIVNAPWPSFEGVQEQIFDWEYASVTGPVVLVIMCLQAGLVAPMMTGLKGEARDQSKGPGATRIVASSLALASVICVPIGYIVLALGESFPWARLPGVSMEIIPILTLVGAVVVAGALFPVLQERWKRGIPIRTSILIAGLVTGLLIAGAVCAVVQIVMLITSNTGTWTIGYSLLAAPVAGWIIATPLLFAYVRNSHQVEPMDRVLTLIFRGTVIELIAILPLDAIVRRQRSCYCFEPSYWSLLLLGSVGLVTLGPMLLFIAGRKNRREITGRCTGCGYDLTGLPGMVCPECGRKVATRPNEPTKDPQPTS